MFVKFPKPLMILIAFWLNRHVIQDGCCSLIKSHGTMSSCWMPIMWKLENQLIACQLFNAKLPFKPMMLVNTLRPRQNGRHFTDDIFKYIILNENVWISIEISLRFLPKGPINNIPALVQIMAWHRPGDKPLSGLMWISLQTHISITRPQWVKIRPTKILFNGNFVKIHHSRKCSWI